VKLYGNEAAPEIPHLSAIAGVELLALKFRS